jgi:hypothetical protein
MLKRWLERLLPPRQRRDAEDRIVSVIRLRDLSGYPEGDIIFIDVSESDVARAVEAWAWLLPDETTIIAVSALGDIVFEDKAGGINLLSSSLEGVVSTIAPDMSAFEKLMLAQDFRDEWFLTRLMVGARGVGLNLQQGECYSFQIPPVLGGEVSAANLVKLPLVAQMAIASQTHRQVSQMSTGDEVSGMRVVD